MKHFSQHNFQKIPVLQFAPETSATAPGSPVTGQLWTDTSLTPRVVKYYNGTVWVRTDGSDIPDGTITNVKIAAAAGIPMSKLALDPTVRSNHSGTQLAATISDLSTVVQAYRLDQFAVPTNPLNLNGQRLTNVGSPTAATDAATRQYVDDARAGVQVKDPVRVAVLVNVNLASPGANLDGLAMVAGQRFLALAQTTNTQNGIYVWNGAASPATRSLDTDGTGEVLDGTLTAVSEGTDAGSQYIQTATPVGAPGAWAQSWVKFSTGGTVYSAGNGLNLASNTFTAVAADASISVGVGGITVGLVPIAKGGTNAITAAAARTNLAATGKFAADIGALTAGVFLGVTHSLNTLDVVTSVRENATGEMVNIDVKVLDANTVQVRSDIAVSANILRIVVVA